MKERGGICVTSSGLMKMEGLDVFLGAPVCRPPVFLRPQNIEFVAGWGVKKSGKKAESLAMRWGVQPLHLEDGFLRSVHPGRKSRPYALVRDHAGIYYDTTRPSDLENLLNAQVDVLSGIADDVARARRMIITHRLSKYNHAPHLSQSHLKSSDSRRILVVDQTVGDTSIAKGSANGATFDQMLRAALDEDQSATVYVKTHPEVTNGTKKGYFSELKESKRIVLLRDAVNPISLVLEMDSVFTVTSTMGFEALLAGKPVSCFGIPWYSGWGVTDDRQFCSRRNRSRSVDELFAAAYFHYTRYINPATKQLGSIFDLMDWLISQKATNM